MITSFFTSTAAPNFSVRAKKRLLFTPWPHGSEHKKRARSQICELSMQEKGLEPSLCCHNRHLKPARLPIPPLLRTIDLSPTKSILLSNRLQVNDNFQKNASLLCGFSLFLGLGLLSGLRFFFELNFLRVSRLFFDLGLFGGLSPLFDPDFLCDLRLFYENSFL